MTVTKLPKSKAHRRRDYFQKLPTLRRLTAVKKQLREAREQQPLDDSNKPAWAGRTDRRRDKRELERQARRIVEQGG